MLNFRNLIFSISSKLQKIYPQDLVRRQRTLSNSCPSIRHYSSTKGTHANNLHVKEIQIPVPFGTIEAKAWGNESAYPVLAFHGWLDNCGTFDKLIPLLSDQFYFVAIDAPGHGKSSHKPPGAMYTDIGMVRDFKRVRDYFGWEKLHIMGHSLGGSHAFWFAAFFPELVDKVISLDTIVPLCLPASNVGCLVKKAVRDFVELEKKLENPPPVYTRESAPLRLIKGMHNEITEASAEILLKRGTKTSDCGKGLIFTRDLRCKPIECISAECEEVMYHLMSTLKCELLMILGNNTNPAYMPTSPENKKKFIELYRKTLKNFVLEHVDGNHFVHLNNPETIAPIINKFLLNGN